MVKKHLKRLAMPKSWKIKRKGMKFVTRPMPGAHSMKLGMSLNLIMRDILEFSKNFKETKKILENNEVLVDRIRIKNPRLVVGFMDALSLPTIKEYYRVIIDKKGNLSLIKIDEKEASLKPAKIIGKMYTKGKLQLNLFDGKNILVDKDSYKVGDSVLLDLDKKKIKDHFKLEKGSQIVLMGGKNVGQVGQIDKIEGGKVFYKSKEGVFETLKKYAFVIGGKKSSVSLSKNEQDERN